MVRRRLRRPCMPLSAGESCRAILRPSLRRSRDPRPPRSFRDLLDRTPWQLPRVTSRWVTGESACRARTHWASSGARFWRVKPVTVRSRSAFRRRLPSELHVHRRQGRRRSSCRSTMAPTSSNAVRRIQQRADVHDTDHFAGANFEGELKAHEDPRETTASGLRHTLEMPVWRSQTRRRLRNEAKTQRRTRLHGLRAGDEFWTELESQNNFLMGSSGFAGDQQRIF